MRFTSRARPHRTQSRPQPPEDERRGRRRAARGTDRGKGLCRRPVPPVARGIRLRPEGQAGLPLRRPRSSCIEGVMAGFLVRNGYVFLFAAALSEQLGAPVPTSPLLIGAGVLARAGHLAFPQIIALAVLASVLGHSVWFWAGRKRGGSVLRLICRISIEPDSCVRRTQAVFARHGGRALVTAPWIPGLAVVAPPLAGLSGMTWKRFLALDAFGALIWASTYAVLGYVFGT